MNEKAYRKARTALVVASLFGFLVSVYTDFLFLGFVSVGLGIVSGSFLRLQMEDRIEDERTRSIHGKAAKNVFDVLMPTLGLSSLMLIYAGEGPFYFLRSLGLVLSYVTVLGMLIYLASYWYFEHKEG